MLVQAPPDETSEEHHSVGGYDAAGDDFDYEEFIEDEFNEDSYVSTRRNLWWYVALLLLILFAITAILPIF